MLADVVVGIGLLVGVIEALEASVGETLLVFTPRDSLGVQKINDGGDVRRNLDKVVIVHGELVTSSSGGIVGLRRMSDSPEVVQGDTLGSQVLLVAIIGSIAVILCQLALLLLCSSPR